MNENEHQQPIVIEAMNEVSLLYDIRSQLDTMIDLLRRLIER